LSNSFLSRGVINTDFIALIITFCFNQLVTLFG
jgi:hypothetical protein